LRCASSQRNLTLTLQLDFRTPLSPGTCAVPSSPRKWPSQREELNSVSTLLFPLDNHAVRLQQLVRLFSEDFLAELAFAHLPTLELNLVSEAILVVAVQCLFNSAEALWEAAKIKIKLCVFAPDCFLPGQLEGV